MAVALTSDLLVRMANTHIWHGRNLILYPWQHDPSLTSDQLGTHPSITSKWLLGPRLIFPGNWPGASIPRMAISLTFVLLDRMAITHIWHGRNESSHHVRMALNPKLRIPGNWPGASIQRMAFSTYIWSCRNQSYSHIRMAQHSHLTWKEHHDRMAQPLLLNMEGT